MLEKGSVVWWAVCLMATVAAFRLQISMTYHLNVHQEHVEQAMRSKFQVEQHSRAAITFKLRSLLEKLRSDKFHRYSLDILNRSQADMLAYEEEEALANEYEELFEKEKAASEKCRSQVEHDESEISVARTQAQNYLDEIVQIKDDHNRFCADHRWCPVKVCDAVGRWIKGDDSVIAQLAEKAAEEEEKAIAAYEDEVQEKELQFILESNATHYSQLSDEASAKAQDLIAAYEKEKFDADELEGKAKESWASSRKDRSRAIDEEAQLERCRQSESEHTFEARKHGKVARLSTLTTTTIVLTLLCVLLNHLVDIFRRKQAVPDLNDHQTCSSLSVDDTVLSEESSLVGCSHFSDSLAIDKACESDSEVTKLDVYRCDYFDGLSTSSNDSSLPHWHFSSCSSSQTCDDCNLYRDLALIALLTSSLCFLLFKKCLPASYALWRPNQVWTVGLLLAICTCFLLTNSRKKNCRGEKV